MASPIQDTPIAPQIMTALSSPLPSLPPSREDALFIDDSPYILSNEKGGEAILEALSAVPTTGNGVHIGFSFWFNLDLIALRQPKVAIICDVNKRSFLAMEMLKDAVLAAKSPRECIDLFYSEVTANAEALFDYDFLNPSAFCNAESPEERLYQELERPHSWLYSEERFLSVQERMKAGTIIFYPLNIADTTGAFAEIKAWIEENKYSLDTLYSSNIQEWLLNSTREDREAMKKNMETLLSHDTHYIDACKEYHCKGEPTMRMSIGSFQKIEYKRGSPKKRRRGNRGGGDCTSTLF
jgi:hypothetical protein